MNPPFGLTGSQLEDALPFCFVALFLTLVPLPAIVFKSARSWAKEQPNSDPLPSPAPSRS